MGEIQHFVGTMSILLIIAAVLGTEHIFKSLHILTHDTPFQDMVFAIEKELMIVGCMAFLFKIIINVQSIEPHWLLALEYSDLFVPLVSFCFCVQGIFLILVSIRQCSLWSKAFHLTLDEVLYEYYYGDKNKMNLMEEVQSTTITHFISSFRVKAELEFKVFNEIFCDQFKIVKSQFQFDSYVERVFEKLLLDIVTIRSVDWLIVAVFALLNYGRLELNLAYGDCHHDDVHCTDLQSITMFSILGVCMFGISLIIAVFSRIYERRLLNARGVETISDCVVFLRYVESQPRESTRLRRFSAADLKTALARIRIKALQAKDHERLQRMKKRIGSDRSQSPVGNSHSVHHSPSVNHAPNSQSSSQPNMPPSSDGDSSSFVLSSEKEHRTFAKPNPRNRPAPTNSSGGLSILNLVGMSSRAFGVVSSKVPVHKLFGKDSRIFTGNGTGVIHLKGPTAFEDDGTQIAQDIVRIFLFSNPSIYYAWIMGQVMTISCYVALWLTNFLAIALRLQKDHGFWICATIIPALLSMVLSFYSVRCAALLKAVSTLDKDIVEELLEDAEAAKNLSISLREKILSRLESVESPEEELKVLFQEIDINNSKSLSRSEFQIFLHDLDITFSRKRWVQIFKQIDRNFDDEISWEELFLFIFPDHNEARNAELQRLKRIRKSVSVFTEKEEKFVRPSVMEAITNRIAGEESRYTSPSASNSAREGILMKIGHVQEINDIMDEFQELAENGDSSNNNNRNNDYGWSNKPPPLEVAAAYNQSPRRRTFSGDDSSTSIPHSSSRGQLPPLSVNARKKIDTPPNVNLTNPLTGNFTTPRFTSLPSSSSKSDSLHDNSGIRSFDAGEDITGHSQRSIVFPRGSSSLDVDRTNDMSTTSGSLSLHQDPWSLASLNNVPYHRSFNLLDDDDDTATIIQLSASGASRKTDHDFV